MKRFERGAVIDIVVEAQQLARALLKRRQHGAVAIEQGLQAATNRRVDPQSTHHPQHFLLVRSRDAMAAMQRHWEGVEQISNLSSRHPSLCCSSYAERQAFSMCL
jgi:hypothetical protein